MKKLLFSVVVMILFVGLANKTMAQGSANATATGKVLSSLSITHVGTELDFGSLIAGTGGTVSIDNAGVRSKTGGVTEIGTTASAASFTIACAAGSQINIVVPTADIILKLGAGGPGNEMTVGTWVKNFTSSPYTMTAATFNLLVGATLTVNNAQTPGTYTSDPFAVTVAYP